MESGILWNTSIWKRLIIGCIFAVLIYSVFYYMNQTVPSLSTSIMQPELPIYCVNTGDAPTISLTFDAAWGDEDLDTILGILEKHQAKATFFVTGDWVSRYPEAVCRIAKEGHDLGNHGDNHKHMTQLSESEIKQEINGCHKKILELTNVSMTLFRAPYGDYDENLVAIAKDCGYSTIQWDVDSLDWKDYGVSSIIQTVCEHKHLGNGSIILLHNGSKYTAEALDELLTSLEEKGYQFVPVSKLLLTQNYTIDHEGRQQP